MNSYTIYEKFIKELVYWFNPLRLEQLIIALTKNFPELSEEDAKRRISIFQSNGHILVSKDGWVTTKGKYVELTGDTKQSSIDINNEDNRIGNIEHLIEDNIKHKKIITALWVMIDMLPDSMDFVLTNKPYQITFASRKTNRLYEIIVIPEDEEELRIAMLNEIPHDYYDEMKNVIRRIAIIEVEDHEWKIPKNMGFTHIVAIDKKYDPNNKKHFHVIKNRIRDKEQIW